MAEGKLRHEWDQTSLLWVTLAEPNRDKQKRPKPFTIYDVHPYRAKPANTGDQLTVDQVKQYFPRRGVES